MYDIKINNQQILCSLGVAIPSLNNENLAQVSGILWLAKFFHFILMRKQEMYCSYFADERHELREGK